MRWFALVYLVALHFSIVVHSRESISEPGILVYPLLLETRSGDGQKSVHLSDGNFVHLQKASVLHDTLTVYSYEKNKRIVQTIESKSIEENLFENKKTLASLLLEETEHGIIMEGLVNHTYRIEPLLEAERWESGKIAHKLYVVRPHEADFNETILEFQPPSGQFKAEARADVPAVFSPDVFIVSDYEHSKHFTTLKRFLKYILVFFNGVKLRYETVQLVRIVPRLVGVERTEWGRDTYEVMYGNHMIAEYTLNNFQSHIEGRLSEFVGADAVMLLTGFDEKFDNYLALKRAFHGECQYWTDQIRSSGMGCSHDQAAPVPNIPGNQGAYHCLWSDGYIMSYEVTDERQFAFSACSQEQFVAFIRYVPQSCIDNTWKTTFPKPSSRFPGDTLSRKEFCRRESGFSESKECTKRRGHDLCKITCCPGKDIYRRDVQRAEYWCLDGTNCGSGKECYSGYCKRKRRK